jgi:radical SAM enzyme (TIGR01210 family)
MAVEIEKFGPLEDGMAASPEVMEQRITLCNGSPPGYFWVSEEQGNITGYMVIQPTHLTPDGCTAWEQATDDGTMASTFAVDGPNLYIVSHAVLSPPRASAGTSDLLQYASVIRWVEHGGVFMFCARMPGYRARYEANGTTPEEYWQLTRADGTPHDVMLHYHSKLAGGVLPYRLLLNGFPPDTDSGGHAALFVLSDRSQVLTGIGKHLHVAGISVGKAMSRTHTKRSGRLLPHPDPSVDLLIGDIRPWWDITQRKFVTMQHIYVPQGCGDWGVQKGVRTDRCVFCGIPSAVQGYCDAFYGGALVPQPEQLSLFSMALAHRYQEAPHIDTLCVFNGGSFLSDETNPPDVRSALVREVATYGFSRLVVESRAEYVTEERLAPLVRLLDEYHIALTIRMGLEAQHDVLRQRVLHKGLTRKSMLHAARVARQFNVQTGAYVLLKPAPDAAMRLVMGDQNATRDMINEWAVEEARRTIQFALGTSSHDLSLDEVYFCSTNVAPHAPVLLKLWEQGDFAPATLTMLFDVLLGAVREYGARVHLLPFHDEPPFVAIPSNHVVRGIAPDLSDAQGCDRVFHAMLDEYRQTLNANVLVRPPCTCL